MAPRSGPSAAQAQAGHQAQPSGPSAPGSKDSAGAEVTQAAQATLRFNAHLHGPLHDNHESLNPITAHVKFYRCGSGPAYEPLRRLLDEAPREQPWSTLASFAKGAEKGCSGPIGSFLTKPNPDPKRSHP